MTSIRSVTSITAEPVDLAAHPYHEQSIIGGEAEVWLKIVGFTDGHSRATTYTYMTEDEVISLVAVLQCALQGEAVYSFVGADDRGLLLGREQDKGYTMHANKDRRNIHEV